MTKRITLIQQNDTHAHVEPHPELGWRNGRAETWAAVQLAIGGDPVEADREYVVAGRRLNSTKRYLSEIIRPHSPVYLWSDS